MKSSMLSPAENCLSKGLFNLKWLSFPNVYDVDIIRISLIVCINAIILHYVQETNVHMSNLYKDSSCCWLVPEYMYQMTGINWKSILQSQLQRFTYEVFRKLCNAQKCLTTCIMSFNWIFHLKHCSKGVAEYWNYYFGVSASIAQLFVSGEGSG